MQAFASAKTVYFITGASGVGKTTLISLLRKKYGVKPWSFFHFDSIGVPSLSDMKKEFGSPEAWQKAKTFEWVERLLAINKEKVFLEGQTSLLFIREAFAKNSFNNYHIILIDCSEEEMERRLREDRGQPELFTDAMKNWRNYLRQQAEEYGAIVLLSSNTSPAQLLKEFDAILNLQI